MYVVVVKGPTGKYWLSQNAASEDEAKRVKASLERVYPAEDAWHRASGVTVEIQEVDL